MYDFKQDLFKVSVSTGKMSFWRCFAEGNEVFTEYGQVGGKMQTMSYKTEAKNVGRSNATTAEEQALVEVQANYKDQLTNKHYRETEEAAIALSQENREPRKVTKYMDRYTKMSQTQLTSKKFNGSRACILQGQLFSKQGRAEDIKVDHIRECVERLQDKGLADIDCEVYAHGLSLQRIRSAWLKPVKTDKEIIALAKKRAKKKGDDFPSKGATLQDAINYLGYNPNEDAPKLMLYIFDIPRVDDMTFTHRVGLMKEMEHELGGSESDVLHFEYPVLTRSHEERVEIMWKYYHEGFEGTVNYEIDGVYEFGKRSTNTAKHKPRLDAEALIVDVTEAKNGQGTLHLRCGEEYGYAEFKAVMKGTAEERAYDVQKEYIGKWVNFQFEDLSDESVPCKPVVIGLRECDMNGDPID